MVQWAGITSACNTTSTPEVKNRAKGSSCPSQYKGISQALCKPHPNQQGQPWAGTLVSLTEKNPWLPFTELIDAAIQ
ncbi:hypothetical protein E2C01_092423 [Portunus trituberculatus]|uniref:Uncharacterized protein n=1 Tax=Portunus trituberculatus TaxID=210409 RepID=A0A5B7JQI8_PORTR|nr:hypothetical protein [Portunus trituberculatus]